jgi:hypothetical protein
MHKPRKANTLADALSRRADHETGDADDNQGVVTFGPNHFCAAATPALVDPSVLTEHICTGVRKEAMVLAVLEKLWKQGPRKLTNSTLGWVSSMALFTTAAVFTCQTTRASSRKGGGISQT